LEYESNIKLENMDQFEELKKENFKLNKKLLDIETYKAKTEYLGESYEELQRNLKEIKLDNKKIRNINDRLTSECTSEKKRAEQFYKDYKDLSSKYDDVKNNNQTHLKTIFKYSKELESKSEECNNLTSVMKQVGDKSNNVLENALSDKLNKLENELKKANESKKILVNDNMSTKIQNYNR